MTKTKNLFLGLGVTATLGFAALPLASYAATTYSPASPPYDECVGTQTSDSCALDVDVNVNVSTIISLSLDSATTSTSLLPNAADLTHLATTATVVTNSLGGYQLTLRDAGVDPSGNPHLSTSLVNAAGDEIPSVAGTPTAGTSKWGIKLPNSSDWVALPASTATPLNVKTNNNNAKNAINESSTVNYGVSTSSDQSTGTYSNVVTYTATTLNAS